MATAFELDKIKCNPIKEGLNSFQSLFQSLFQSACADLPIAASFDVVQAVFSTATPASMSQRSSAFSPC